MIRESDPAVVPVPEGSEPTPGPDETRELRVTPDQHGEINVLRAAVIPVASYRLEEVHFDFDSSFVRPEAAASLAQLALLRRAYPRCPLSIFGHADPSGQDDYNKALSGRRARAVYALLTRTTALWEWLFQHPHGRDDWGVRRTQTMLAFAGRDTGPIDGVQGSQTNAAIRAFQEAEGLAVDGIVGPLTRARLFEVYMDRLCRDSRGERFVLAPGDFLAGGADEGGKGDVQGCSEFNPEMVFSTTEAARYAQPHLHPERDRENAVNRRVLLFLFRAGSRVDPAHWPCPRVDEGPGECRKRFWSDGEARRSPQAERREYRRTHDTFACRFFDRIVRGSDQLFGPPPDVAEYFGRPRVADDRSEKPHSLIVPRGHEVVLHWRIRGAVRVRIEAMTLHGQISNLTYDAAASDLAGEAVVAPAEDMVYTLSVTGASGAVEFSQQVKVLLGPAAPDGLAPIVTAGVDFMELRALPGSELVDLIERTE